MRKIDIFNEVLQQHDEPTVLTTTDHPGVVKMNQWFKQVGRELTDSYEIPESIVPVAATDIAFGTTLMPEIGRVSFQNSLLGQAHPDRVISAFEGPDLDKPITLVGFSELVRMRNLDPSRRLPNGEGGRYGSVATMFNTEPANFGDADQAAPRLCVWPIPATGTTLNLRIFVRRNRLLSITDLEYCPFPSHLVILGLKWYFKMDRLGADDPETVAAREAYRNGVASHVSFSASFEGNPMNGWDPV
jgi:hypothetical protein